MRNIVFWHGYDAKFAEKLLDTVTEVYVEDNGFLAYKGTLEEFAKEYDNNFIVLKCGSIAVTPHNSFAPR